ncbi:hypothetical protein D9615_009281 [Tricholomella constricta]|uniref:Uncharacterized protein n=1 Tax=Tricholomella constricta TaxID=117010 RepID=A0A8H5GWJ4_9AGAR|nr:hypothetical protein D9615_009281 [Tricholomella constricta]
MGDRCDRDSVTRRETVDFSLSADGDLHDGQHVELAVKDNSGTGNHYDTFHEVCAIHSSVHHHIRPDCEVGPLISLCIHTPLLCTILLDLHILLDNMELGGTLKFGIVESSASAILAVDTFEHVTQLEQSRNSSSRLAQNVLDSNDPSLYSFQRTKASLQHQTLSPLSPLHPSPNPPSHFDPHTPHPDLDFSVQEASFSNYPCRGVPRFRRPTAQALESGAEAARIPELFWSVESAVFASSHQGGSQSELRRLLARVAPIRIARLGMGLDAWWNKERLEKTAQSYLPNAEVDVVRASLTEEKYGVVQRDIPRVFEAILSFPSAIEEYHAEVRAKYTPPILDQTYTPEQSAEFEAIRVEVNKAGDALDFISDDMFDMSGPLPFPPTPPTAVDYSEAPPQTQTTSVAPSPAVRDGVSVVPARITTMGVVAF